MENVFVDTNIVIDLLQKRDEFYKEAQELFTLADRKKVKLYISALTFANTYYILSRFYSSDEAKKILSKFKVLVEVLPTTDKIIELALASDFKDFEDAVQYFCAKEKKARLIITNDKKGFQNSDIDTISSSDFYTQYIQ